MHDKMNTETRPGPQAFAGKWASLPLAALANWASAGLSAGALFVFLAMVALAKMQHRTGTDEERLRVKAPPGGWATALGLPARRVRFYRAELLRAGLILADGNGCWRINYRHEWWTPPPGCESAPRCTVPLDRWPMLRAGDACLWAALCRYAPSGWHKGGEAVVFASLARLAEDMGAAKLHTVTARWRRLAGLLMLTVSRRGSRAGVLRYTLLRHGGEDSKRQTGGGRTQNGKPAEGGRTQNGKPGGLKTANREDSKRQRNMRDNERKESAGTPSPSLARRRAGALPAGKSVSQVLADMDANGFDATALLAIRKSAIEGKG